MNYTLKHCPEIPTFLIREAFQKRDVKMNGVRCGRDALIQGGSTVMLYLPEGKIKQLPILYQSEEILILHKPAGIPCESSKTGERTILELANEQIGQKLYLCHRLDAQTEGLLVLARTEKAMQRMQDAFRQKAVQKEYVCLVKGCPEKEHDVLTAWITKDALHGEVQVHRHPAKDAKEIVTEYWVLQKGLVTRLRIRLHTGRTHQIRAHMAFIGHPVLGDDRYGDRDFNKKQKVSGLKLCSVSLSFLAGGAFPDLNGRLIQTQPSF